MPVERARSLRCAGDFLRSTVADLSRRDERRRKAETILQHCPRSSEIELEVQIRVLQFLPEPCLAPEHVEAPAVSDGTEAPTDRGDKAS